MNYLKWSRWVLIVMAVAAARNHEVSEWWIVGPLVLAFGIDSLLIWWGNVTTPKITIN